MRIKRQISILIIGLVLLAGCSKKPADFRNVNWGDSQNQVARSEDTEYLYASDDFVMYKTQMNDEPIEIYYSFTDNTLAEAQVKFIIGDRILRDLVASYDNMANYITSLYGTPLNLDKVVWVDNDTAYANDDHWVSILNHRMIYLLEWETETTYMKLLLECPDMKNINYIYYACPIENK